MGSSSINRLLLLGVAFHLLCISSIFDIYFQSPVESGIPSLNYTESPPAKRVILFTLDGCRVDKLFQVVAGKAAHYDLHVKGTSTITDSRATDGDDVRPPFLGQVMRHRGSWGVSHNHVPTESRPCHVALTAGMYEDPHAVTTQWTSHPVPFDSVFNQSSTSFIYGNRDVVPMLAKYAPQVTEEHYTAREEMDMVRRDASLMDEWVFTKVKDLFARGTKSRDLDLYTQLHQEKLVLYCHFLSTDVVGPIDGADSTKYLQSIAVVDGLIEQIQELVEEYYGQDGQTAYVVTGDHGMDLLGDHGDDEPAMTRTALIAWGAGVQGPEMASSLATTGFDIELPTQSRAELLERLESQVVEEQLAAREWKAVLDLKRKDVMQVDVAPLVSALAGLPYPRNSVGILPFTYLKKNTYRALAMRANAQQLYQHASRKEEVTRAHRGILFFPYTPLHSRVLDLEARIDEAIGNMSEGTSDVKLDDAHRVVEIMNQEMVDICQRAISYYQTYDWMFLRGSIVFGYIGWVGVMIIGYLHPSAFQVRWLFTHTVSVKFLAAMAAMIWWRYLANSPLTYYLYGLCPLVLWKFIWSHREELQAGLPTGRNSWYRCIFRVASLCAFLELVALGYRRRDMFTLLFVLLAFWPRVGVDKVLEKSNSFELTTRSRGENFLSPSFCWSASCLVLAVFPCLSSFYTEDTSLVYIGSFLVLALACIVEWCISAGPVSRSQWKAALSVLVRALPVLLALVTLQWTTNFLDNKKIPPSILFMANWTCAVAPPILMLIAATCRSKTAPFRLANGHDLEGQPTSKDTVHVMLVQFTRVTVAFTPAFALLSTAYEVLFYVALCSALISWIRIEAEETLLIGVSPAREVQRALMLLLFAQMAFFGTNSVASITSFKLSSSGRFLTGSGSQALVVLKLLIPHIVVGSAFRLILLLPSGSVKKELRKRSQWVALYHLVAVSCADALAVHLLFRVTNQGSWKQMGNSIADFCIVNAQIVLLPTVVGLARVFVGRDLESSCDECDDAVEKSDEDGKKD
uniref:GPI ethanolamine phosphate transferase 1 n=1 Tax=Hyaloperonospora arabidopsidis (strain Emoy2) TaxID=559515 RepID=M4B707_HYAAE